MRKTWDTSMINVMDFKQELESLIEIVPKSVKFHQKCNAVNKSWNKVRNSLNEMEKFITPVKSISVKSPLLNHPDFVQAWELWKEYLIEQHSIFMYSRAELMALKRMADISKNDPVLAIQYLEYPMSRLEKNFYAVNEIKDTSKPDKSTYKQLVVKFPKKYYSDINDPLQGLLD